MSTPVIDGRLMNDHSFAGIPVKSGTEFTCGDLAPT